MGRAIARRYAREGAWVLAAEVNEGPGQQTVDQIVDSGGDAEFRKVNVAEPDEVEAMVAAAVAERGRLDVIVNNAGIIGEVDRKLADCSIENFDKIISINLRGVFLGMKYALPQMVKQGGGAIVNVASLGGLNGVPNLAAYSASKGGVVLLTKTAALEYGADNIRVNAICPGFIVTGMTREMYEKRGEAFDENAGAGSPLGRSGQPEEIADVALFLGSDQSSYVTGVAFPVDGGSYAR